MTQSTQVNRRIVLASRPHGAPTPENFRLEEQALPTPAPGEVLLRAVYLSLDPYMRGRMSDGPSYAEPVALGAVMVGATVSRVVASKHEKFAEGDWVLANSATGHRTESSILCAGDSRYARLYRVYGVARYW